MEMPPELAFAAAGGRHRALPFLLSCPFGEIMPEAIGLSE
jgi:hypothetical protein